MNCRDFNLGQALWTPLALVVGTVLPANIAGGHVRPFPARCPPPLPSLHTALACTNWAIACSASGTDVYLPHQANGGILGPCSSTVRTPTSAMPYSATTPNCGRPAGYSGRRSICEMCSASSSPVRMSYRRPAVHSPSRAWPLTSWLQAAGLRGMRMVTPRDSPEAVSMAKADSGTFVTVQGGVGTYLHSFVA